jgi:hypothetical protein
MASKFFERRSVRNQLKIYLESKGWLNLTWSEGYGGDLQDMETVVPPFIAVLYDDMGREELEMGRDPNINKIFSRRAQINLYMESEDRLNSITDDISDFLDIEVIIIKDNSSNILGTLISDTETIIADLVPPIINNERNILWEGVVACSYQAHYPNG